jgi:hypothetical protein
VAKGGQRVRCVQQTIITQADSALDRYSHNAFGSTSTGYDRRVLLGPAFGLLGAPHFLVECGHPPKSHSAFNNFLIDVDGTAGIIIVPGRIHQGTN